MVEIERCWCQKSSEPCRGAVTQEDMLCDTCRAGCNEFRAAPVGTAPEDMPIVDGHAKFEGSYYWGGIVTARR